MDQGGRGEGFAPIADFPIDEVRVVPAGFVLEGRGARDRRDYRLELRFDVKVDARTKTVLGELLSQAEVRVLHAERDPARE